MHFLDSPLVILPPTCQKKLAATAKNKCINSKKND